MVINQRIELFSALGNRISNLSSTEFDKLAQKAHHENGWFTKKNIKTAFEGLELMLDKKHLEHWVSSYQLEPEVSKEVGVVMAGNIPMVGFHDLLNVLISGHHLVIKPSSGDTVLIRWLIDELGELEPRILDCVSFEERLNNVDAIIATGSDNSARYFEYYFSNKPHIIRKNRSSCAVIEGSETVDDIINLGKDILTYFGLGCRNVSKLYVPKDYDFRKFLDQIASLEETIDHHKYKNNYDYNKSIYLVNVDPHFDSGFLLLKESEELVSPIAVVYYEYYSNQSHLDELLKKKKDKIQCIAGTNEKSTIAFGKTQFPKVSDYADDIDTLQFLSQLSLK